MVREVERAGGRGRERRERVGERGRERERNDGTARKEGRPKRRFADVVREDTAVVEVKEEDAEDRIKWRGKICCGAP